MRAWKIFVCRAREDESSDELDFLKEILILLSKIEEFQKAL